MIYKFGDFLLDVDGCVLSRADEIQRVPPKVLQTLILLVEARGAVLTKEQMMEALWPDAIVEEGGLARNISNLRKLLDDGVAVSYIQTIPKRGYRFIGDLEILSPRREANDALGFGDSCNECLIDSAAVTTATLNSNKDSVSIPRIKRSAAWTLLGVAAIVGTAWAAMQLHRPEAPRNFAAQAVTTNSHHRPIRSVAISPDGRFMAYVETDKVLVRSVASNESTSVSVESHLSVQRVDWFPDSSRLLIEAFSSELNKSTTWWASASGGTAQLLLQDAIQARVSPDGKLIGFQRASNELWLANFDGTNQRLLAKAPEEGWFTSSIRFSPDSSRLLSSHYVPLTGRDYITALSLKTGALATVYESASNTSWPTIFAKIQDFLLLPGNELLVARAMQYSEVGSELISIDLSSTGEGKPSVLLQWPRYFIRSISADRSGNRLALIKDYAQADVYIAQIDIARNQMGELRRLTLDDATDIPTAWSEDSLAVLFHSNRNGTFDLFRQSIDSPRAEQLVATEQNELRAVFAPDGRAVWYIATSAKDFYLTGLATLRSMPLDGTSSRELMQRRDAYLTARCAQRQPVCVLAEQADNTSVFRAFDPSSGIDRELLRLPWQPSGFHYWALSPDGTHIAVIEPNRAHGLIRIYSLENGTKSEEIRVQNAGTLRGIYWDPSGDGFYITNAVGEAHGTLLWVGVDGSTQVLKHNISSRGWAIPSPDGSRIAFQEWTHSGNIWSLQR